jgi:hypothetical protein
MQLNHGVVSHIFYKKEKAQQFLLHRLDNSTSSKLGNTRKP